MEFCVRTGAEGSCAGGHCYCRGRREGRYICCRCGAETMGDLTCEEGYWGPEIRKRRYVRYEQPKVTSGGWM